MTRSIFATLARRVLPLQLLALSFLAFVVAVTPAEAPAQDGAASGQTAEGAETEGAEGAAAEAPFAIEALLQVLTDEEARQTLIAELERIVSGEASLETGTETAAAETTEEAAPSASIGARVAEFTQDAAQGIAGNVLGLYERVTSGETVLDGLSGDEIAVLLEAFQALILVIVVTVAVYLLLRRMLVPLYSRMGQRAEEANALRTVFIFIESLLLDILTVIAAWGIGYVIAVTLLGDAGQVGFRQALYLNAFLLVELVKVAVRAIISPASGGLRLVNVANRAAVSLNRHVNLVVSVLGYGQLLIVPIVNRNASLAAGTAVSAILSIVVLAYLVVVVIRSRDGVANWIARRIMAQDAAPEEDEDPRAPKQRLGGTLGTLTRTWHWFVLAYLAFMVAVVLSQPNEVVFDYILGSAKVFAAVLVGSVIVGAIGGWLREGIHLPSDLSSRLPLLEDRLNRIVPKLLIGLRVVVALAVVLYAVDAIGLLNIGGWLSSDLGIEASGRLVSVVLILAVAGLIWLAMNSWVDYRLSPDTGKVPTSRETTLLTLMRNAATIVLIVLTLMFALAEIGINIGPLLASAGVLGLAIGFGAQKMVQDIITGVFIQFENAMNVGDVVTVGGTTGVVEKLTVRSVSLRDLQGTYHIIPFSSVDMVSNFMRDFSYFVCDMGIAYREDIEEAKQAMFDGFAELREDPDQNALILGDLEWFGLNSFGDSAVVLRARIKTVPGSQWGVGRAYNGILKRIFDERGIEIPFPHQTIFFGEAKDGRTQALRLRKAGDEEIEGSVQEEPTPAESAESGKRPTQDAPPDEEGPEGEPGR
ncbi:mechanosensitive ion channel [Roseivivax sp. GX 12232]|uniref:mechanosensitive ion channel domain-containing protein n=1 Tax=Roseivivax sp. GX 12232 TaxID=2900547 RepID=UPI001E37C25E|nr:mechanosensitive ion channel domain-containing protein [Roseivivax sp. GX 12232]MCE0505694.1 mechanosensitive ion channel [Roseivivax sp. GX 12232]